MRLLNATVEHPNQDVRVFRKVYHELLMLLNLRLNSQSYCNNFGCHIKMQSRIKGSILTISDIARTGWTSLSEAMLVQIVIETA